MSFGTTATGELLPRRIPPQNLALRLHARQVFGTRYRRRGINTHRGFHTNIFPDFTLVNVEKPPCFLRKFTPDGKSFIAFSSDQTSLEVYDYQVSVGRTNISPRLQANFIQLRNY